MISLLGPALLVPYLSTFFPLLDSMILQTTPAQITYVTIHPHIDGVAQANDHPLAMKAVDVLTTSVQVLSDDISNLSTLENLWEHITVFMVSENSAEDLISCYSLASTILEVYDDLGRFVVSAVLPMLPVTAEYRSEYCRSNTFYLLSLLITTFPQEMESRIESVALILQKGLQEQVGDV